MTANEEWFDAIRDGHLSRLREFLAEAHQGTGALLNTPSTEELLVTAGPVAATDATVVVCMVAPFACLIEQASLVSLSTDVAASNSDYYTITVRRYRAAAAATIATLTTQSTSTGQQINQMEDWNFDSAVFDRDNQQLVKSDVVAFSFTKTGTPDDLASVLVQARYRPL